MEEKLETHTHTHTDGEERAGIAQKRNGRVLQKREREKRESCKDFLHLLPQWERASLWEKEVKRQKRIVFFLEKVFLNVFLFFPRRKAAEHFCPDDLSISRRKIRKVCNPTGKKKGGGRRGWGRAEFPMSGVGGPLNPQRKAWGGKGRKTTLFAHPGGVHLLPIKRVQSKNSFPNFQKKNEIPDWTARTGDSFNNPIWLEGEAQFFF